MRERYNIEPGGKWLGMDISAATKKNVAKPLIWPYFALKWTKHQIL